MARKKGSKNKGKRAKARSAYETYSGWYDTYTKGEKENWFSKKYTKEEFEDQYLKAKQAGMTNPARSVAQSQEYVNREFERSYKKIYGKTLPKDVSDKATREQMFWDYVDQLMLEGMSMDDARKDFEEQFGY